ncbi:solute carrier family 15 member 2 [Silurus meridionalis]|nr:solute carrier family 15 member 2 [Silurus meridionalis]
METGLAEGERTFVLDLHHTIYQRFDLYPTGDLQCFGGDCYALVFGIDAALRVAAALMVVALELFIGGSKSYRRLPPGGNDLKKVCKCIGSLGTHLHRFGFGSQRMNKSGAMLRFRSDQGGVKEDRECVPVCMCLGAETREGTQDEPIMEPSPLAELVKHSASYSRPSTKPYFRWVIQCGAEAWPGLEPGHFSGQCPIMKLGGDCPDSRGATVCLRLSRNAPHTEKFVLHKMEKVHASSRHVAWQVPQYIFITAGEVMFSIAGVEFSYSHAPDGMKSLVQALWLLNTAVGNVIVLITGEMNYLEKQKERERYFLFIFVSVKLASFLQRRLLFSSLLEHHHHFHDLDFAGLIFTLQETFSVLEEEEHIIKSETREAFIRFLHSHAENINITDAEKFVLHKMEKVHAGSRHVAWQVPQYIITAGEVMFSITGEFSYSHVPDGMKSLVQALWLLNTAVGNVIVLITGEINYLEKTAEILKVSLAPVKRRIKWRIVIHGGYSRLTVFLHASNNNRSTTVMNCFLNAVAREEDKETWWWNEEVQESRMRKRLEKQNWDRQSDEKSRQENKEMQQQVKRDVVKAKEKAYE